MGELAKRLKELGAKSVTDVASLYAKGEITREDWEVFSRDKFGIIALCR